MPALKNKKYFNYGGQGPLPAPSLEAITNSWERIQDLGPFTSSVWPYIASEIKSTKRQLASICGVPSYRIALTENVTSGCVLPLLGLPFSAGERILISNCEHPGIVYACREMAVRQQLHIDILPVQKLRKGVTNTKETEQSLLEILDAELRPKTKLVVLSHLLWNTGQIMSISKVAKMLSTHSNNPFLLVDAAQSFGQIPIRDAAYNADIYAFTGHKWACGPEGLGGVAISDRVLEESKPTVIGWRSLQHEGAINETKASPFHFDSRRFEVATSCIPLLAGLKCSLDLLEKENAETERLQTIQTLSSLLWTELQGLQGVETILQGPPPAGLVSFNISKRNSSKEVVKLLGKENIWIRDLDDPICLRACLHITSEITEIKSLVKAIEQLAIVS